MRRLALALVAILLGACSNAQRALLEKCEALENQGDLESAAKACDEAATKDRTTKWGELAYSKGEQLHGSLKARLEARAREYEEAHLKWEQDITAGRIPRGTPPPGAASGKPGAKCNCTPGDPLCSCL